MKRVMGDLTGKSLPWPMVRGHKVSMDETEVVPCLLVLVSQMSGTIMILLIISLKFNYPGICAF